MWNCRCALRVLVRIFLLALFALTFVSGIARAQGQPVLVTGVDDDTKKVGLIDLYSNLKAQPGEDHKRTVDMEVAKKMLNRVPEKGDVLVATPPTGEIKALSPYSFEPGVGGQLLALGIAAVLVLGVAASFTWGRFWLFLIGKDNRYSNSQTQVALWFGAAMTAYLSMVLLRGWAGGLAYVGGVQITANVLALSGLSAITFGGAKIVTAAKTGGADPAPNAADAKPAGAPAAAPIKKFRGNPNLLTDLVKNDYGDPDLGDFQMIVITLTAVIIYLITAFNALSSIPLQTRVIFPDVDTSLLGAFGIGQGAYLVKKAAQPPGQG